MDTLATELIKEVKANAKRWFIIAIIELVIIAGLVVYIFIPTEETTVETTTEQEVENTIDSSSMHQQSNAKVGD